MVCPFLLPFVDLQGSLLDLDKVDSDLVDEDGGNDCRILLLSSEDQPFV